MNESSETITNRNKDTFRSLAELLLSWWERHEAEWKANGFDNTTQIKKLKGGDDKYAKTIVQTANTAR